MYHVVTQIEAKPRKGGEPEEESRSSERSRDSEEGPGPNGLNGADIDGADGKKERVLHTRVPAVLERELKRFADNLRIPVSNLVRTILEDALNVADAATENVESRLKKAAKQLEHERERLKARVKFDPLKDVFAFQDITLAQDATCAKCERDLAAGTRASLGLTDEPPNGSRKKPRIFVCDECLPGKR
jgi:hypothetical protein